MTSNFVKQPDDLDESLPLEPMRLSAIGDQIRTFKDLLSSLVESHPKKLTKDQKHKLRDTYRLVLLNVICNSSVGYYTALPRGSNAYDKGTYWNKCGLSYRITIDVLDRLEIDEFIKPFIGFYVAPGIGRLTRIYALPKLAEVIDVEQIVEAIELPWNDDELITLTGFPYKADALPDDHPDIVKLKAINAFLKGHDWPLKAPIRLIYKNTPVHSGRLYTRFQNMPKAKRMKLKIDGKPTVELDYKANHLSMVIVNQGGDLPPDPYMVIANDTGCSRDQVKRFMTASLGAESETKAFNALKQHRFNKELFNQVKESCTKNFGDGYLFKGIGTALQSLEGQIALDIMYQGSMEGVPILPVHDSFITTTEHEEWLRHQMEEQWTHHTNDNRIRPRTDKKN